MAFVHLLQQCPHKWCVSYGCERMLKHISTHQTDKHLSKQHRKNEVVKILSSIALAVESEGSKEKGEADAASK